MCFDMANKYITLLIQWKIPLSSCQPLVQSIKKYPSKLITIIEVERKLILDIESMKSTKRFFTLFPNDVQCSFFSLFPFFIMFISGFSYHQFESHQKCNHCITIRNNIRAKCANEMPIKMQNRQ